MGVMEARQPGEGGRPSPGGTERQTWGQAKRGRIRKKAATEKPERPRRELGGQLLGWPEKSASDFQITEPEPQGVEVGCVGEADRAW